MEISGPPEGFNTKEDIKKAPVTLSLSFFFHAFMEFFLIPQQLF